MARILILGAGRGQVGLIQAIKRYGHEAIVATIPGEYPGIVIADEVYYANITQPDEVDEIVRNHNIQGVCTCCLDTGMASLGYVCDKHGLNGVSYEAAKTAQDKVLMKEKMLAGGVRTPRYMAVANERDLEKVKDDLNFPVIIKPVDQQGSLGVTLAESADIVKDAYVSASNHTNKEYCLAEEYIDGEKHGANGCVVNGKILFLLPSEDITDGASVLGHVFPFDIKQNVYDDIVAQSTKALEAVGIDNCIFNVDCIVKDEQVYIIEITGRMGANGIPQLLSIYYGIDIYKVIIDLCLGENVDKYAFGDEYVGVPCCSQMLISKKSGILKEIRVLNSHDCVEELSFFVSEGEQIHSYTSAKDCVGQLIVKGATAKQSKNNANRVMNDIDLVLEV